MKKSLLLLGVAVAAITSCTNDEVLDINTQTTIGFETFVNKDTRAVVNTTTGALQKFFVYGYYGTTGVFDGMEVTKSGANWTYNSGVHTPWTGGNYYFAAYASTNNATGPLSGVTFVDGKLTFNDYKVKDTEDLVAAWKNVDNSGLTNPTVGLDFKHMLSKVYFEVTNGASESLTMELSDIEVKVKSQGDCVYNGSTVVWNELATEKTLVFDGTASVSQGNAHTTTDYLVIPGQTGIVASFTAKFYNGAHTLIDTKDYTDVSLAVTGDWQAGNVYKYTATVSPTMPTIEFSASVTDWVDKSQAL